MKTLCLFFLFIQSQFLTANPQFPVFHNGRLTPFEAYSYLLNENPLQIWKEHFLPKKAELNAFFQKFEELMRSKRAGREEILHLLDMQFPLSERLKQAGEDIQALPGTANKWYSLRALRIKVYDPNKNRLALVPNFTLYSDKKFDQIRKCYFQLEKACLAKNESDTKRHIFALSLALESAYSEIAGQKYLQAHKKALFYPTLQKLSAETLYHRTPWIEICLGLYLLAFCALLYKRLFFVGSVLMATAFLTHTSILALRCYILGRAPVSNMFESVLFVPWIAVLASSPLYFWKKNNHVVVLSALLAFALFSLVKITRISIDFENIQPVLDSQFWLIIHVLMVVSSYGMFLLAGLFGHVYLFRTWTKQSRRKDNLTKPMLNFLYLGTILLIPGTLLGGVWAQESWGRFWDWDPKEAWAFISASLYLILIHAYRFNHIKSFGLAIGAVLGLQVISFTWYGVNYILGTGLHSYGFGAGGELYYYLFLIAENAFLLVTYRLRVAMQADSQLNIF